jgi:hypothetical protein
VSDEARIERSGWFAAHPLYNGEVHVVTRAWFDEVVGERDALATENQRLRDALRYITGRDVAGYAAHMRPEEVARAALVGDDPK